MLHKLLKGITNNRSNQHRADLYRNLIRHEAQIGGEVFGPVPAGHRREFFCLDEHTWVWHEEWRGKKGQTHVRTTRYDVRPDSILKSQNGQYQQVSPAEAVRLYRAAHIYVSRVKREVYGVAA